MLVILSAVGTPANVQEFKIEGNTHSASVTKFEKNVVTELTSDNEIVLKFSFEKPVITNVNKVDGTYNQVTIEGLPKIGEAGVPLLPVKPINVLLPQKNLVELITIIKGEAINLGDDYNVELGVMPEIIMANSDETSNINIRFNPMLIYPTVNFDKIGIHDFRGYSILTFNLHPVQYLGITGELLYFDEIAVTITMVDTGFVNPLFRRSPTDEIAVKEIIDDYNIDRSKTYVAVEPEVFLKSLVAHSDTYNYVVITSEELKNSTGGYTFQDLVQYKINNGVSATIVTIEDINSIYSGVDLPEKIRNFTKDAYLNWDTEYVLLGGDVDVVPARLLWVQSWSDLAGTWPSAHPRIITMPSDLYYGCLDGTFNYNGDDKWGEPNDGNNGGDVDLRAEIYIGRACVGNDIEVSNFVMKTLNYEQTLVDDPYLKKALMVGEDLYWAWGGIYKDEIINGSSNHGYSTVGIPYTEYNLSKLYDLYWENYKWPKSEIISRINAGFNIINHLGHANLYKNMKMNISDVNNLMNNKHCFIYSQGCNSGGFDADNDCIAEYFTVKTSHGAFAGIWNARYGWGMPSSTNGPSQKFDREFFDAIFNEGLRDQKKTCLGVANQDSKEDNLWRINEPCMRWCYYELNLFGDPQVSLKPVPIPEHDVAVDYINILGEVLPDVTFEITTKIFNQGSNAESDISGNVSIFKITDVVNLKENLVYIYPWNIDFLASGDNAIVDFDFSVPRGLYRIITNIDPILGEEIIFNNNLSLIVFIGDNFPPEKPSTPICHQVGWNKYEYTTNTIDPDGDQVYYKWSWGYNQYSMPLFSSWLGPYESSETITTPDPDYFHSGPVEVIAQDVYGALSVPSDPAKTAVSKTTAQHNTQNIWQFSNSLINQFIQSHLNMFLTI